MRRKRRTNEGGGFYAATLLNSGQFCGRETPVAITRPASNEAKRNDETKTQEKKDDDTRKN
jgi:hypothetical protein